MNSKQRRVYPNLRAFLEDLKRQGITQAEFSKRINIGNGYLSDIKNGRVTPSLKTAKQLADACGVPIESFLSDNQSSV